MLFLVFLITYILSIVILIFELFSAGTFCVYRAALQKLETSGPKHFVSLRALSE